MAASGEVVTAARAYLAAHDGYADARAAAAEMAAEFGVTPNPGRIDLRYGWDRFRAAVYRAFDRLDADGDCRKVKANRAGPDGTYTPSPRYFTDAAWRSALAAAGRRDADTRAEAARYAAIHGRVAALGVPRDGTGRTGAATRPPELPADGWERLLDMAEAGGRHWQNAAT